MKRTNLATILGIDLEAMTAGDDKTIEFLYNGISIATVWVDDLFDHEGDRFDTSSVDD